MQLPFTNYLVRNSARRVMNV